MQDSAGRPHGDLAASVEAEAIVAGERAGSDVSLFSINREGTLVWNTPSAQVDLASLRAFAGSGTQLPRTLTRELADRLWMQVEATADRRQFRLLNPSHWPCGGFVFWTPARPDRVSVMLMRSESPAIDPLWVDILARIGRQPVAAAA